MTFLSLTIRPSVHRLCRVLLALPLVGLHALPFIIYACSQGAYALAVAIVVLCCMLLQYAARPSI